MIRGSKNIHRKIRTIPELPIIFLFGGALLHLSSCTKKENNVPTPIAYFSHTADTYNPLLIAFGNESYYATSFQWDFGDGEGRSDKKHPTYTYNKPGNYTVKLKVQNQKNQMHEIWKKITISERGLRQGDNILLGGDMNEGDLKYWTVMGQDSGWGNHDATIGISDGVIKMYTTADTAVSCNYVLYQPVNIEKGKKYKFSTRYTSSGTRETWWEFNLSNQEPIEGQDYRSSGKFLSWDSWSCLGSGELSGYIQKDVCKGVSVGKDGLVTPNFSGDGYFVVKIGTGGGSFNISMDSIQLVLQ